MKTKQRRNVAGEIIDDLRLLHETLATGKPLSRKFTVRTVRAIPRPGAYGAPEVRKTRQKVGVSQSVFAELLGVSPALVRAWENGQRQPAPIARRLLDIIKRDPSNWRQMIEAA